MATEASTEGSAVQADTSARARIGRNVIYFALGTVGLLGLAAVVAAMFIPADAEKRFSLIRDVFTMLLPVLGTWVGTVLAFYFSRENFAEAAKQTAALVKQLSPEQKLEQIAVAEAMISLEDMSTAKLVLSKPEQEVGLHQDVIVALFDKHRRNRLPVIDAAGRVQYVLHRSMVDGYIAEQALAGNAAVKDATLKDLLAAADNRQVATAFGAVAKTTTLIAVKQQIDGDPNCSDVFVTEDGTKGSKAIGWITNVIVAERAKV